MSHNYWRWRQIVNQIQHESFADTSKAYGDMSSGEVKSNIWTENVLRKKCDFTVRL